MIAWLVFSAAIAANASIAIWSRRPTHARGMAVLALLVTVPLSGGLLLTQRGWSTPIVPYLAELPSGEIVVDGVRIVPGKSITVTLHADGASRLFELPWDAQTASQLQRMLEGGEEIRATRREKKTGRPDDDFPMEFHPRPQPSYPEKQPEQSFEYERSE